MKRRIALIAAVATAAAGITAITITSAMAQTSSSSSPSSSGVTWPTATSEQKVDSTIKVSGTLDGGMKRYYGVGDGSQSGSQPAMFELEAGATLKNVIIGAPAGDGVHCKGNCTIDNVWWEDVGEDAATFRGGTTYTVKGGAAKSAKDKTFQHNSGGTVYISNFYAEDIGKLYRSCGNCSGNPQSRNVVVSNTKVKSVKDAIVGINERYKINGSITAEYDTAKLSGITVLNDSSKKTTICQKFEGINTPSRDGEKTGKGPDTKNCLYAESDITWS